jgi:hypothetical protein
MNVKKILIIAGILCVVCFCFHLINVLMIAEDEKNGVFQDKTEYPLDAIDSNDNNNYMLVMQNDNRETIKVIVNTALLKANIKTFYIKNKGSIHGITPDGDFHLYKNGELIETTCFDEIYTYEFNYGTLENKFRQINEMKLLLLLNAEVYESDAHYTVLKTQDGNNSYLYHTFVHLTNKESIDGVKKVDVTGKPFKIEYFNKNKIKIINSAKDAYYLYNIDTQSLRRVEEKIDN